MRVESSPNASNFKNSDHFFKLKSANLGISFRDLKRLHCQKSAAGFFSFRRDSNVCTHQISQPSSMSSLLSVCRAQSFLEEDSLEAVPEEDQPQTRSPPAHPPEEAVALIAVAADRKKSSSAGGEGRKKSSKGGDSATGKRRKSSLFLRLKNFKSLPSISLPRIFNLSKLLKKEKSQPTMTLAAGGGGGGGGGAAAVSSLLLAAGVPPKPAAKPEFWLGEGRIDAVAVAAGGWKRRRKGRIRTVVVVKEVREIKCSSHRLLDLKRSLIDSLCQSLTNSFYLFTDFPTNWEFFADFLILSPPGVRLLHGMKRGTAKLSWTCRARSAPFCMSNKEPKKTGARSTRARSAAKTP
jgi:hypothetical protein